MIVLPWTCGPAPLPIDWCDLRVGRPVVCLFSVLQPDSYYCGYVATLIVVVGALLRSIARRRERESQANLTASYSPPYSMGPEQKKLVQ